MTEAEFLTALAKDRAAHAMLAALRRIQAATLDSRVDRNELVSIQLVSIQRIASAAIAAAKAAGIREDA